MKIKKGKCAFSLLLFELFINMYCYEKSCILCSIRSAKAYILSHIRTDCASRRYAHSRRFPLTRKISDNCATRNHSLTICSYIINFVYLRQEKCIDRARRTWNFVILFWRTANPVFGRYRPRSSPPAPRRYMTNFENVRSKNNEISQAQC